MSKIQKNFLKFKNVKISRELQVLRSLSGYGHWRGAGRAAAWQRPTLNIFPVRPFNFCQQISLFFKRIKPVFFIRSSSIKCPSPNADRRPSTGSTARIMCRASKRTRVNS